PAGCGTVLTAASTWKAKTVVLGNSTNEEVRGEYTLCNDWIKAPQGKKVQVQLSAMEGVDCHYGCWAQGIEIKMLPNKQTTNP
ncbi:hypothetical protein TELCIR_25192, partial [Teladorsagia circumcincta]